MLFDGKLCGLICVTRDLLVRLVSLNFLTHLGISQQHSTKLGVSHYTEQKPPLVQNFPHAQHHQLSWADVVVHSLPPLLHQDWDDSSALWEPIQQPLSQVTTSASCL